MAATLSLSPVVSWLSWVLWWLRPPLCFSGASNLCLKLRCSRPTKRLSQVSSSIRCDDLWGAPLGRMQPFLACRKRRMVYTPVTIAFAGLPTFGGMHRRYPLPSYSRRPWWGWLSSRRVLSNDPSNRAFLRNPVSSLASRPDQQR